MAGDYFSMERHPRVSFSISDFDHTVDSHSELWTRHLPSSRHPGDPLCSEATLGHYFQAAMRFFSANDYGILKRAAFAIGQKQIGSDDIADIAICLVKHGTFYHPSRADIHLHDGDALSLALNLAVSSEGKACIDREFSALELLAHRTDALPAVYGKDHFSSDDGIEFSMFAAQWLDDYHEFHISRDGDQKKIIVWDECRGHYFLTEIESQELYKKAAFILASCYNPVTCEQIQPWHHAAGDFVVKNVNGSIDVKLITVRQYTSLFHEPPEEMDSVIEAALIFLINLSIRMRLDREDGIKETVWADESCLSGVVKGFWEGLATQGLSPDFKSSFTSMVSDMADDELMELATMLIQSYHPESPELSVISSHLGQHINALSREIKRILF